VKIVLDECCHRRLIRELAGAEVHTVQSLGWNGLRNGDLLRRIEDRFDVFVTQDQNIPRQNRMTGRSFAVVVLKTKGGLWSELKPLMPRLREVIERVERGSMTVIE
jgi:hypothetical protein